MKHYLSRLNEDPVNALMVTHAGGPFVIDAMVKRASMRGRRRRVSIVGTNVSIDRRKSRLVATRGNDVGNNAATKLGRTLLDRRFCLILMKRCSSLIGNFQSIINNTPRRRVMTRTSSCVKR